jgi:hypothetical protein
MLRDRIKTLTSQCESLEQENGDLRANAEKQAKRFKRIGNTVIKNADSVKYVINSELL